MKNLVASQQTVTILGLGSLLSENSSRLTFPSLMSFRIGRVFGYRRIFGHAAAVFVERGIANKDTLEMASLSAELSEDSSFICSIFEVPKYGVSSVNSENSEGLFCPNTGKISDAFREREEEFDIRLDVPYVDLPNNAETKPEDEPGKLGILCCKWTDKEYIDFWGQTRYIHKYQEQGIPTIWDWGLQSGLKPCPLYLRHCLIAANNLGEECYRSFLDETYLVDRQTTVRQYLESEDGLWDKVMSLAPPPGLSLRYNG